MRKFWPASAEILIVFSALTPNPMIAAIFLYYGSTDEKIWNFFKLKISMFMGIN